MLTADAAAGIEANPQDGRTKVFHLAFRLGIGS